MGTTSVSTSGRRRASSGPAERIGYAVAGLAALAMAVYIAAQGDWRAVTAAVVLAIAPDIPLAFGFAPGLEKGRLHPRAVPAYNTTHRFVGPAVTLVTGFLLLSHTLGAAGFAWLAHALIDRACGFGLRTKEGWQR